jgi:hypothetical protein
MNTVERFKGISPAWARGLVEAACDKLSHNATRDYTLAEVAAEVKGDVVPQLYWKEGEGVAIMIGEHFVEMLGNPAWVEMGGEHSTRKQHYPVYHA